MPDLPQTMSLEALREATIVAHPEFAASAFSVIADGWDSVALDIDDRFIVKFPRHAKGEAALRRETALLSVIGPRVSMPVPKMTLFEAPNLHTLHEKLGGSALDPAAYALVSEAARQATGERLGLFYAELHAIDPALLVEAGAGPVQPWLDAETIASRISSLLPTSLVGWADAALTQWAALNADPHGTIYGFFDGHGWNMAFDPQTQHLRGVFDFGDSGFGLLHQEFIYSNLIAPDLTGRIIDSYELHSGRMLDRDRIRLLTDIHRLWEIACEHDDPVSVRIMLDAAENWLRIRD